MSEEAKKTAENEEAKVEESELTEETEKAEETGTPDKSEDTASEEGTKGKHRTTLRFLLLVILLVAAWFAWQKHQRVNKFNKALEAYNEGKLEKAEDMFMQLYKSSNGDIKKRAKIEVIRVILDRGDAPSNNIEQSVVFYKRAFDLDPKALQAHQLRSLKNFLSKQQDKDADAIAELDKVLTAKMEVLKKTNEESIKAQQEAEKAREAADKLKKDVSPKE